MAYIRIKYKKGNPYYYIVEGRRIGGKVKQVILEYIGPLEKLEQLALSGYLMKKAQEESAQNSVSETTPSANTSISALESADLSFKAYGHGAVMAMLWTAQQLGIEEILDESFSHKTIKGMPRSRVMLLAMLQRAIELCFVNRFSAKSEKLFPVFGSGNPFFRIRTWKAFTHRKFCFLCWHGASAGVIPASLRPSRPRHPYRRVLAVRQQGYHTGHSTPTPQNFLLRPFEGAI